jgi:hypothetical protein
MKELVKPLLICALLGSPMAATAETMSCFVDTPALDRFTPHRCFAVVFGARFATALFRVDRPLPNNYEVLWSDTRCDSTKSTCAVRITAFLPKTMEATVLNLDNNTFFRVSATASFENGS